MRYSGREFSEENLATIRTIIHDNPKATRRRLSEIVCERLEWYMADGDLKDMSCRKAMMRMAEDGLIRLPPARPTNKNRSTKIAFTPATDPYECEARNLNELGELTVKTVTTTPMSKLWNEYIARYHYLGHKTLTGAQLRYFVYAREKPVALLGFSAAAWRLKPRDEFIGWNDDQRRANLHLVVGNSRFLLLPWLRVPNLASNILSLISKRIRRDWQGRYDYEPVLLESFVQKDRFDGGCYRAANWTCLGETKGRGKLDREHKADEPVKSIWVYPLIRNFRGALQNQDEQTEVQDIL
jgi:hypothetical protein